MKITKLIPALFPLFLLFSQISHAQWRTRFSGLSTPQRGLNEISAPDTRNCYATVYDQLNYYNFQNEVVFTHDGGDTWTAATIDSLENNFLMDITASSGRVVHVIGWNSVAGGGNVFRSKDGGATWQREAANAFRDAASYPDDILFFTPRDGLIFGDPAGGCFEIYKTSDGGDTWTRIPCANIPPSMAPAEGGLNFMMDHYNNTVWAQTVVFSANGSTYSRLLQSDDKGLHWYVKCSSMPLDFSDGRLRFRNDKIGLYKNNGKLYRTTDGGATWNRVNYSGTWFSRDLDNVPGRPGTWISTGGGAGVFSLYGRGSSISYDDGDTWHILDTAVNHTCIEMSNAAFGFGGGVTDGSGGNGAFVYSIANNNRMAADFSPGTDAELSVYPNPNNGRFKLKSKSLSVDAALQIYSAEGRLVHSTIIPANTTETFIDLKQSPSGAYQLRITEGEMIRTMRVVKN